jgi:hypothetical protein
VFSVSLLASIMLLGTIGSASAQTGDMPAKNFSIKLNGGFTYASAGGSRLGPLVGQFDVDSYQKSVYGGALQYAFNPTWSFEAAFNTGKFENQFATDPVFSTDYMYATFRGVSHLNGLLDLKWAGSRFVNPYFAIGMGMMRTRLAADGLQSEDMSLVLSSSAGALFYLFNSADLFVQYDYNLAGSNLLDGFSGSTSSDKFAAVNVGVRINFGRKGTKLASWSTPPPVRRSSSRSSLPLPSSVAPAPAPAPDLPGTDTKRTPEERTADMSWLSDFGSFMESPAVRHPEFVQKSLEHLQSMREARIRAETIAAEQAMLAAEREKLQNDTDVKVRRAANPPDGTYIQIGSYPNDRLAEENWHKVVAALEGVIVNPARSVFIQELEQNSRVLIGPFGSANQARTLLSRVQADYGDAFLIRFPRY